MEKRLVEVAEVVVELPVMVRSPVNVEEALVKIMEEVVAETPTEGWVKGSEPPPPPVASSPSQREAEPVICTQVAVAAVVQPEPVDISTWPAGMAAP